MEQRAAARNELSQSIRRLYEVFSNVPRPLKIDFCPCGCTKAEEVALLLASPLRELRLSDLENYSASAICTQGTVEDFRYFLPRLFEGIANEPFGYVTEVPFGKLNYAEWSKWPPIQVEAIRSYLRNLWALALNCFPLEDELPAFGEIETLLASIAQTGESLLPYLQTWSASDSVSADVHLIQFTTFYGTEFAEGRTLTFAFWEELQAQALELRRWLLEPQTMARIQRAAPLLPKDGYEHLFEPALAKLQEEFNS